MTHFNCIAACRCGARFDKLTWKLLELVAVRPGDRGPVTYRACPFCASEVSRETKG